MLAPTAIRPGEQHVLVTGGSKGLGLAVAVYAASRGANVTILARDRAGLAAAKQQIEVRRTPTDSQPPLS